MARCDIEGCGWRGKAAGLAIHKARQHDIHPQHDDMSDLEPTSEPPKNKPQKPQSTDPLDALVQELEEEYGR